MPNKEDLRKLAGEAAAYRQELERAESTWKDLNKQIKESSNLVGGAKAKLEGQIASLEKQYQSRENIKKAIKEASNEQKEYLTQLREISKEEAKLAKAQQKNADDLKKRVNDLNNDSEEYLDLQYDISKSFGKTTDHAKMLQAALQKTKTISGQFASLVEEAGDFTEDEKQRLVEVAESYNDINRSIIQGAIENKKGIISAKQYARAVSESMGEWDKIEQKVQDIVDKNEDLAKILAGMGASTSQTGIGAQATSKSSNTKAAGQLASDALAGTFGVTPEMEGAVSGMAGMAAGGIEASAGAAIAGVGATPGLIAAGYGAIKLLGSAEEAAAKLNPKKIIDIQRAYEAITSTLDNQISQLKQYAELQAGIPKLKAELDFEETMSKNTAAFNAASKTAFFGSELGSPKYAKDQLQLLGITANDIVTTMSEMSKTAGSAMQGLGEDVAVFSKKTGIGAGELGNVINTIRIFDKTGGGDAFKTMQKSLSKSKKDGYNLADITDQLANSTELAAEFGMGSYDTILKQIQATRELGGNFDKIGEAGKSMVVNYKDTIKKEMELSAMIGERVDLSSVMAKFNAGDREGAFKELKSMNLYEKTKSAAGVIGLNQLKSTLGGMGLSELMAGVYEKDKKGQGLESNASFLSKATGAQKQLSIDNAIISAEYALLTTQKVEMAQIGAEFYSELSKGINVLLAQQTQQKFMGQIDVGIEKKLNAATFGARGPSLQGLREFDFAQYGFQPSATLGKYGRVQQNGYLQPSIGGQIGMSLGNTGTQSAEGGMSANEIERQINIAKAMDDPNRLKGGGDTFEDYVKKYGVSQEERVSANRLLNPGNTLGKGLNADAVNALNGLKNEQSKAMQQSLKTNQASLQKLQTIDTSSSSTTQLLKSLRDLTAIMMDPDRAKDFNVQLNMDGKQIHNVLIRNTENLKGTTKGGVTFATK